MGLSIYDESCNAKKVNQTQYLMDKEPKMHYEAKEPQIGIF
jgi:hypothetical protein